jgi:hypothetical protein
MFDSSNNSEKTLRPREIRRVIATQYKNNCHARCQREYLIFLNFMTSAGNAQRDFCFPAVTGTLSYFCDLAIIVVCVRHTVCDSVRY